MAVKLIAKLYVIEKAIKEKRPEERYDTRQQKSKPQLEKLNI
jgi:hypothetical protein